ncbi:MAG: hypothetical protein WBQ78_05490 [Gammaproteobacteria bacterium]
MITSNPFADLSVFLPPLIMQVYIVLMILAVAMGRSGASETGQVRLPRFRIRYGQEFLRPV